MRDLLAVAPVGAVEGREFIHVSREPNPSEKPMLGNSRLHSWWNDGKHATTMPTESSMHDHNATTKKLSEVSH